jgi:N-acetylneuraminic acid mutarotase
MSLTRRNIVASALAVPASAAAQAQGQGRWRPLTPMPWAAQEIYCAAVPGSEFIVVAGGLAGRANGRGVDILDRTGVFDGATWHHAARLPRPTHHPALAAARERVFAFGGFGDDRAGGQWSARTDVLAMESHTRRFDGFGVWEPVGRMPTPQCETVALADRGLIHLIGGRTPRGQANAQWEDHVDTDAHQVYDPGPRRWTPARPLPMARNSAAGAVIDHRLYVVGGRTVGGGNTGRLDRYDAKTDRWETLRPMPQGAGGIAAAALRDRLYVFGGEWFGPGGGGVFGDVWEYDPKTDAWRAMAPMRTPRHGLAAAAVFRDLLVAIGGATQASARATSAVVESFEL